MNDSLKSIAQKSWHEPRRFFAWLMLFSLVVVAVGYTVFAGTNSFRNQPDWLGKFVLSATAIGLGGFVLGFGCFVLAWIPPVRRLLAWLLQRRFYVLVCLVTLVALFYAEENWRGKRAWDKYRHEWEAKGERFDFASFVPPPVPDDQNFALTPVVYSSCSQILTRDGKVIPRAKRDTNFVNQMAMNIYRDGEDGDPSPNSGSWQKSQLADLQPWQNYYRHPKAGKTNEFPVALTPQTPAADVLLALSKYDSTIEELREAAKLPYCRYPLNYDTDQPFNILLPHLSAIKSVARVLNLRSLAELEANQPDKALADLKLCFHWNETVREDSFLISHLVRIAGQGILMQSVWQGLAEHKWSDAQLAELERELGKADYLADFHHAMRGERACSIATIEYVRHKRSEVVCGWTSFEMEKNASASPKEMLFAMFWYLAPSGSFYQTQLAFAQMHQRWNYPRVDLSRRQVSPTAITRLAVEEGQLVSRRSVSVKNIMVAMLYPALGGATQKFTFAQASVDLARTAIALERYRLARGEYPSSLDALAPQFIAQVPHDVIGGAPLKYRREANGQFVLYSVGWNETDDGGVPGVRESGSVDISKGDWVWRYPQK